MTTDYYWGDGQGGGPDVVSTTEDSTPDNDPLPIEESVQLMFDSATEMYDRIQDPDTRPRWADLNDDGEVDMFDALAAYNRGLLPAGSHFGGDESSSSSESSGSSAGQSTDQESGTSSSISTETMLLGGAALVGLWVVVRR